MEPKLKHELIRVLLEFFQEAHYAKDIRMIPRIAGGIAAEEFTIEDVREIYGELNRAIGSRKAWLKQRGPKNGSVYMITEEGQEALERMKQGQ